MLSFFVFDPKGYILGIYCRGEHLFWIHTQSPPPDFGLSDWPKGVGESIYSGFTHNPHHLILDSVIDPKG